MIGILVFIVMVTAPSVWAAGAPVRIDDGDTVTVQADISVTSGAAVLIKSSNANRASLNCTVSETVRWGPSGVTTTSGQRVLGNSSVAIRNTGTIYMIAEVEDSIVSCTEESHGNVSGPTFSP